MELGDCPWITLRRNCTTDYHPKTEEYSQGKSHLKITKNSPELQRFESVITYSECGNSLTIVEEVLAPRDVMTRQGVGKQNFPKTKLD